MHSIKKLRKMGFDSWNWENHKEVLSSVAKASSFLELLERQICFSESQFL